ncbi:MAG: NAD(+)/NADH kinase [Phycisphaerae bacterium]|nr:NAD(+)/NADH kinase [Phycisphaerae bacterium]
MCDSISDRRVFILGNPEKGSVALALSELENFASRRCRLVGAGLGLDAQVAVKAGAEVIIVLGGDGTLLGVAHSLGAEHIPLIGVNLGRLGFLANFSVEELKSHFDRAIGDAELIEERLQLDVNVFREGHLHFTSRAVNDCVIQAGPPFRSIELSVFLDGQRLTNIRGDGVIVCTPTGSTAHNLSAGGPIVQAGVHAILLTPLCPHSLTHKPLVVEYNSRIEIVASKINPESMAIIDGQVSCSLEPDDRTVITRSAVLLRLVRNPLYPPWNKLVTKFRWGQSPE